MYVLLGPQQQVEIAEDAPHLVLLLSAKTDRIDWLVFRKLENLPAGGMGDLIDYLGVMEAVEREAIAAVRDVIARRTHRNS